MSATPTQRSKSTTPVESTNSTRPTATHTNERPTASSTPKRTRRTGTDDHVLPLDAYSFDFAATLERAHAESSPPRVVLELTNTGDVTVVPTFGPTPPFSTPVSGWDETTDRLALFHPSMGPDGSAPTSRIDGCWQLSEDAMLAVNAIARQVELTSGEGVSNSYRLYSVPTNSECFPDGEHTFTSAGFLPSEENAQLFLEFTVVVEANTIASVTAADPEIRIPDE